MSKHKKFSTKRIVIDALLISLFFVLSLFSVELGGVKSPARASCWPVRPRTTITC